MRQPARKANTQAIQAAAHEAAHEAAGETRRAPPGEAIGETLGGAASQAAPAHESRAAGAQATDATNERLRAAAGPLRWPAEDIWETLAPVWPDFTVEIVREIGSTNTELVGRARAGRAEPTLLVAERQVAGRGRLGKPWQSQSGSQPGDALSFSLGLPLRPADWAGLSLAVGAAVARELHPAIRVKWPNDLWVEDRKLAGILIETAGIAGAAGPRAARYVVVGIGLNILPRDGQGMSVAPACVQELLPGMDAPAVLGRVVPVLAHALRQFEAEGFEPFRAAFEALDLLRGREVSLSDGRQGVAEGVAADGGLLVRLAGADGQPGQPGQPGELACVTSAEISVRPRA